MLEELKRLRARKEELLIESDINRQVFVLDITQLQLKAGACRESLSNVGRIYKWAVPLAGAMLGFVAGRKRAKKARQGPESQNGHADNSSLLKMLVPVGASLLRSIVANALNRRQGG